MSFRKLLGSPALDLAKLIRIWTALVVRLFTSSLVRVNGRVVLLADGLKAPKEGKKMPAVKSLHQESAGNTKPTYIMGHSCQAVALLVQALGGCLAVPLVCRIHEGVGFSNRWRRTLLDKLVGLLFDLGLENSFYLIAAAEEGTHERDGMGDFQGAQVVFDGGARDADGGGGLGDLELAAALAQEVFEHGVEAVHVPELAQAMDVAGEEGIHPLAVESGRLGVGQQRGRQSAVEETLLDGDVSERRQFTPSHRHDMDNAFATGEGVAEFFARGITAIFTSLVADALAGGAADLLGEVAVPAIYSFAETALGAWDQRALSKAHVSKVIPLRQCTPPIETLWRADRQTGPVRGGETVATQHRPGGARTLAFGSGPAHAAAAVLAESAEPVRRNRGIVVIRHSTLTDGYDFGSLSPHEAPLPGKLCNQSAAAEIQTTMATSAGQGSERRLLSGNEAIALAARDVGVALGAGYPGTPSTEILEHFARLGGQAQWSPNEKVALEVCIGVAYAGARALATMKHVGLNVASDPFFTVAYTGVTGALVVISADDPGMASSQNEQDNRRYAVAAGVPMLEPADSQEAYDYFRQAVELSERWRLPVLFRVTTRVCHSKSVVQPAPRVDGLPAARFERDVRGRVMIPAYARPAHRRLRQKLAEIAAWNETSSLNQVHRAGRELGIVTSGISYAHARDAAPDASVLKLGMTYPLPLAAIRAFTASVDRCFALEEGDPYLLDAIRAAGIPVEGKAEMYRFGEFDVARVRRILAGDTTPEPAKPPGKPPQLCDACSYRPVFGALNKLQAIVAGDIGCYTLGALSPFEAMDTCVCMGASLGVGLGLRHVLPPEQAKRVVSIIGDSTFVHSGISGLVEMVYNPPPDGHVLIILDNSTTAMTGHQEHPGTGRTLDHRATGRVIFEELARGLGIRQVHVVEPRVGSDEFEQVLTRCLESRELAVIIVRRPCILIVKQLKEYERPQPEKEAECACETPLPAS